MRACQPGFIDELEAVIGKPVVTSTQAFLRKLLRVAGIRDQISARVWNPFLALAKPLLQLVFFFVGEALYKSS